MKHDRGTIEEHAARIDRRDVLKAGAALAGSCLLSIGPNAQAQAPRRGGVLKLGTLFAPVNFDPYTALVSNTSVYPSCQAFAIYYEGNLKPVPGFVESWSLADDNRSVRLKLRQGVRFHDGRTATVDDFLGVLDRAQSQKGLAIRRVFGFVKNFSKADDSTVVMTFNEPMAESAVTDLLVRLPILPRDKNDPAILQREEFGAGPFRLVKRQHGVSVDLERFQGYWESGRPYLDAVSWRIFDNVDTMVGALRSGAIDGATYVPASHAAALKGQFQVMDLSVVPGAALVDNVLLNAGRPPFNNKKLRQAVQRCIDRERIVRQVGFGYGQAVALPFQPGTSIYDAAALQTHQFDLAEAKRLYEEAGKPPSATALVQGANAAIKSTVQIIQADLRKIGFDLKIQPVDQQTFNKHFVRGDFEMVVAGLGGGRRNPLSVVLNQGLELTNSVLMPNGEQAADYVDAMKRAGSVQTPEDYAKAYADIRKSVLDSAVVNAIRVREQIFVMRKGVNNFTLFQAIAGCVDLTDTWLS